MAKQRIVIAVIVLINLLIGRIFHESLNLVCISELFIVAGTSLLFWNFSLPYIRLATSKLQAFDNNKTLLVHSVLGISTSVLNVLISQAVILIAMIYIYNCTSSPSFSFLNASLTNNIAINLCCYAFLAVICVSDVKQLEQDRSEPNTDTSREEPKSTSEKIILSSNNQKELVAVNDIIFIEASNNCIVINTKRGKFVKYQSLKSFIEEINSPSLKRVHRSHAVNLDYISAIEKNKNGDGILFLNNGAEVRFSRNYKNALLVSPQLTK